jgi:hypothetical protein
MEKFCALYISNWKRTFFGWVTIAILIAPPPHAWGVTVSVDTTISADTTIQQDIDTDNVTLTNDATIDFATGQTVVLSGGRTGVTIINNSGATINATQTTSGRAINAFNAQDLTITNSGTISSTDANAIRVSNDTNLTITNNSGGLIKAGRFSITLTGSGGTITNSGTITTTSSDPTISSGTSTGLTITNNVGGVISTSGSGTVISLSNNDSIINSGSILNNTSVSNNAIQLTGNNNTITLKEGSLIVGTIQLDAGTTGNTLKIEQGFGQAYFYETSGTGSFSIEDLSGNTAVKGSAGSVGQGANESVDELLGLRTYNLRSALKRFAAFPQQSDKNELYAEPFSFYSKRGTNSSVLSYENYGGGINFIYPLKQHKLDLLLSVGRSEIDFQGNHDVSRHNFLAGVNATDFASLGNFKFSGFFVGGMEWHNGDREIYTNTTTTGKLDVTSDYTSYEAITGSHASYSYSPDEKNTWKTEVGLTFGYSLIQDYEESQYFAWEERDFVQGSIHIGEQLTSKINDKVTVTVGGELEHRKVLMGREQSYAINGTTVDYRQGSFWENTAAGRLGATYLMDNNTLAYVNLDSRFSNQTRGTYGASVGMKILF